MRKPKKRHSKLWSYFEYASAAWSPFTKCSINQIEAVQKTAARFIINDYTYRPQYRAVHFKHDSRYKRNNSRYTQIHIFVSKVYFKVTSQIRSRTVQTFRRDSRTIMNRFLQTFPGYFVNLTNTQNQIYLLTKTLKTLRI